MDWVKLYNDVYSVLATHAGAHEAYRDDFVRAALQENHPWTEWRFGGIFGFGGKVWRNDGRIYISCYPEDRTPERAAVIEKVNTLLKELLPAEGVHGPPKKHEEHLRWRAELVNE